MMMSVFEGGDGSTSGGRSERSRVSGDLEPDDARERCGVGISTCISAAVYVCSQKDVLVDCLMSSCSK